MLITGLEGPITIASAMRSASSTSGGRLRLLDPLQLDAVHLRLRRRRRSGTPAGRAGPAAVSTLVRTGASHIGSTRASTPSAAGDLRLGVGRPPALVEELAPVEAGGEVAVGEAEPVRRAELGQPLEDGEAVVADAPSRAPRRFPR